MSHRRRPIRPDRRRPGPERRLPRDRPRQEAPSAAATRAARPNRGAICCSRRRPRKERERAEARTADPSAADRRASPRRAPPVLGDRSSPAGAHFDDAWPQSERARPPMAAAAQRRAPSTFAEPSSVTDHSGCIRQPPPDEGQPPVTVLKSGRRRWHGLFTVFGWLDRGPNAGRHDAVSHRSTNCALISTSVHDGSASGPCDLTFAVLVTPAAIRDHECQVSTIPLEIV